MGSGRGLRFDLLRGAVKAVVDYIQSGYRSFGYCQECDVKRYMNSQPDKEEKTKNPVMAQVSNAIRKQNNLLTKQIDNTILEWNPGNHFVDSEKRTTKGFAWVMNK